MLLLVGTLVAVHGCGNGDDGQSGDCVGEVGPLEIGLRNEEGVFVPMLEGEMSWVELGPNGLNMVTPSLRVVEGIDPRGPDPRIEVWVEGLHMAGDIEGSRMPMESDGTGYVLWDLRVPFMTELCCYVCRPGEIIARLTDTKKKCFEASLTVMLARAECPDPTACCATDLACPDPELTLLCGG